MASNKKETMQEIKNYIFQGGSVKGIAYIGALENIEKIKDIKLENIEKIGGTSVGAITASLLSIGYDCEKLNYEMDKIKFQDFIDIKNEEIKRYSLKYITNFKLKNFGELALELYNSVLLYNAILLQKKTIIFKMASKDKH